MISCLLILLTVSFAIKKFLWFDIFPADFCFCCLHFECHIYKKSLWRPMSRKFFPFFLFFKSFTVWGTFKSLIHFIFVYDVRYESSSILLCVNIQFSQNHLWKRPSFLFCTYLTHLSNTSWRHMHGFISGLSVLLHWSVCLGFNASTMHAGMLPHRNTKDSFLLSSWQVSQSSI